MDLIERQAAIDALKVAYWDDNIQSAKDDPCIVDAMADWAIRQIKALPSAQPEQQWIPCSERMPEEHEWIGTKRFGTTISDEVYVTFEAPNGERFTRHISFQNGKLSPMDEQRMKVWYKGAKPIAWMPLPEPYKGGKRE